MKRISFQTKVLGTLILVSVMGTLSSIFVSKNRLEHEGRESLIQKAKAILSRVDVGSDYIAQMKGLDSVIAETVEKFPSGKLPEEQKLKVLRNVPIYAALKIAEDGAEEQHYQFRVATDAPRNEKNRATPEELKYIEQYSKSKDSKEIVVESKSDNSILVIKPVYLEERLGCLTCHGDPKNSPWKNDKDVLGYKMEGWKDGDLRGVFIIKSSLAPVDAAVKASTKNLIGFSVGIIICGLLFGYSFLRKPLLTLGRIAKNLGETSHTVTNTSESLAASSQQLASSSQQQAASVHEVSSSVEEISGMVSSTLEKSKEAVSTSEQISTLVNQGSSVMADLQKAVTDIANSNQRVNALVKKIEEIGTKTELIDEIVFQTRLLSFNASVEAERAGEHGRGFAVVAQEVGNLAQMSGKSAAEISKIVLESIQDAKDVSKLSEENVRRGVDLCKQNVKQLNDILNMATDIVSGSNHILKAAEEQNSGVRQINESIQLITKATSENASLAEQSSANSTTLSQQGRNLTEMVVQLEELVYGGEQKAPRIESTNDADKPKSFKRESSLVNTPKHSPVNHKATSKVLSLSEKVKLKEEKSSNPKAKAPREELKVSGLPSPDHSGWEEF